MSFRYLIDVVSEKNIPSVSKANPWKMLRSMINLLEGIGSRNALVSVYKDASDGTQASGTVTFTGAAAHGAGTSNKAFTFTAGATGNPEVTVAGVSGITIAASGTAATDAAALRDAINASDAGLLVTATANAGDVRLVSKLYGNVGNAYSTVVDDDGGGKLAADAATLTGGTPTGSLGNIVVGGTTVAMGNAGAADDVDATAAACAALLNANATVSGYADAAGSVVSHDPVVTVTATLPPPYEAIGNQITLTASVGSASGAKLAGGVNATDNSYQF